MAKGDFNLDDNYYVEDVNADVNLDDNSYGQNGDFSNVGMNKPDNVIEDANVLFEDPQYETGSEKIKYFFSTLNKKVISLFLIIALVVVAVIVIIYLIISSINASYKSDVDIPNLVYMNETTDVYVKSKGKKEVDKTKVNFSVYKYILDDEFDYDVFDEVKLKNAGKSENIDKYDEIGSIKLRDALYEKKINKEKLEDSNLDNSVLTFADPTLSGKNITNTLIPIQEGRAIVKVTSRLNKHKMADIQKKITICPAFDGNLIYGGKISLIKGNLFTPDIDFGLGNCSEGITYSSSDEDIFTVSETGEINPINVGNAVLTIAKDSRNFSVPVYVTEEYVNMDSISFTPKKVQLVPGQNTRIRVTYKPNKATSQNFKFQSDDENVASVSETGLITGISKGTTIIKCLTNYGIVKQTIAVTVSEEVSNSGANITDLKLEADNLVLSKGSSHKIVATIIPENASNKKLTYNSADTNIVTVNKNGVIVARSVGETVVTVTTANSLQKAIKIEVTNRKMPVITASDKVGSGRWHDQKFTLDLSGADSGSTYYYGTSEDKITKKGTKININKDQNTTYYVKACMQKNCSEIVKYVAMLDTTKPTVKIALNGNSATIASKDSMSMVYQVCVTAGIEYSNCTWKTITPAPKPVLNYTANKVGTFYVFAKDKAGNVSEVQQFYVSSVDE